MTTRHDGGEGRHRLEAGLLLAAQLAGDRGAALALPALASVLGARVCAQADALDALAPQGRADRLRATAAQLRAVSPDRAARLPPRARALLAADVPRALGSEWQRNAPEVRRGFSAGAGVRAAIRAAASDQPSGIDAELAGRELGRGRALLARAAARLDAGEAAALIDALGAAEAGAVLALSELLDASEGAADALADSLLDAARRTSLPRELVRALGAMALALDGDVSAGDARSHAWRRVAREIAAAEGHALDAVDESAGDADR